MKERNVRYPSELKVTAESSCPASGKACQSGFVVNNETKEPPGGGGDQPGLPKTIRKIETCFWRSGSGYVIRHDTYPEGPRVLVTEVEALVSEVRRRRRGHVLEVVIARAVIQTGLAVTVTVIVAARNSLA